MPNMMSPQGKVSSRFLKTVVSPNCGYAFDAVPGHISGRSTGFIEIGGKKVSTVTKPLFFLPDLGLENASWFAMHYLFSAAASTGLEMKYLTITLNLPRTCTDTLIESIWKTISAICVEYKVAIISSRIERNETCAFPWVGSATVICEGDRYFSPAFVKEEDSIIVTKGPAVSATALLTAMFPVTIAEKYGQEFVHKAIDVFNDVSAVEDVETVKNIDGIHAMLNAADLGVSGSIIELAENAGLGVALEDSYDMEYGVLDICKLFGLDPDFSFSSGSLIIACSSDAVDNIISTLGAKGISAKRVGKFIKEGSGYLKVRFGIDIPLLRPREDLFWKVFNDSYKKGLK